MLLSIAFFAFSNIPLVLELSIFLGMCLILLSYHLSSFTIKFGTAYLVMVLLDVFVVPQVSGWFGPLLMAFTRLPRYVLLILLPANLLIKTTAVSEFSAAFRKMHIPEQIIIPFSVMFRFIPTIQEEWHSIQNAMKLRGIATSAGAIAKKPLQTLEYGLIPILVSVSTISNELAAASLSRGLEAGTERTCLTQVTFRPADYFVVTLCIAFITNRIFFS